MFAAKSLLGRSGRADVTAEVASTIARTNKPDAAKGKTARCAPAAVDPREDLSKGCTGRSPVLSDQDRTDHSKAELNLVGKKRGGVPP